MKSLKEYKCALAMLTKTDDFIGRRIAEFLEKCPDSIIDDINSGEVYESSYRNKYGTWHFESPEDGVIKIRFDVRVNKKLPGDSDLTINLTDENLAHGYIGDIYQLATFAETQFVAKSGDKFSYTRDIYDLLACYEEDRKFRAFFYSGQEGKDEFKISSEQSFNFEKLNTHGRSKYPDRET